MISWITASHDPRILNKELGPSLAPCTEYNDELIIIDNASSITEAYATGQQKARYSIKCYIHHDVRVLQLAQLRHELIEGVDRGAVAGVIGSRSMIMPWWNGDVLGSVQDGRTGTINFGPGGSCAVLDGLLLATKYHVNWDQTWPGWHGYDYDACAQFYLAGRHNWCISEGHQLVSHNSDSPYDLGQIDGWNEAVSLYHKKWTVP